MSSDLIPARACVISDLQSACRALEAARRVDDVKIIRDQAEAFRHYARERGYGINAINDAAEIKLRAERRLGELLRLRIPHPPGPELKDRSHDVTYPPTLQELGVPKIDASRWQRISGVSAEAFEAHVVQVRDSGQELTTAGVLRLARQLQQPGKQEEPFTPGCTVADLQALVQTGQKFSTIYADPPWPYDNQATRASTDNHYPTLSVADIAALPVGDLTAENAQLHLWTTNAFLPEAFALIEAWGFAYKSIFVWCKPQMGIGNYWRVAHEFLLLGVQGRAPFLDKSLRSWAEFSRGRHSAKPDRIRNLVERAWQGPRLELFGRDVVDGWTVWGNQIDRDLFHQHQETIDEPGQES